jgi:Potential Queuosine, Q, salvage protein family
MGLCDHVRENAAAIAASARHVSIDLDRLGSIEPGPPPVLDPERHFLEGSREDVAAYLLTLDAINFGSGWFPTLRKRPGSSGYYTVSWALADHWRAHGPWSNEELRALDADTVADVLGQERGHELMQLYAQALNDLGDWLGETAPLTAVKTASRYKRGQSTFVTAPEGCNKSALTPIVTAAEALAESLRAMPFFDDVGFWKRAQITANDFQLAGIVEFDDIDVLTIFADNLVPHVLRVDGVLVYDDALAARIDSGELLPPGDEEREIRGCAVHACELIARELGVAPRTLDVWLWNRGQGERYKSRPRHRTRTVYY